MRTETIIISLIALWLTSASAVAQVMTPVEQLGKFIFFDTNLSVNSNQSCAACHTPEVGWTGPIPGN